MKTLVTVTILIALANLSIAQISTNVDDTTNLEFEIITEDSIRLPDTELLDTIILDCPFSNHLWEDPKIPAQFPGGVDSMRAFITRSLALSKKEWRKHQGEIIAAELTIDTIGNVLKVEFLKAPLNDELTKRFEKLCQSMPNWYPAKENSKRIPPHNPDDPIGIQPPLPGVVYVDGCMSVYRPVNSKKRIIFRLSKP